MSVEAVIYNAGMNPKAHQPDSFTCSRPERARAVRSARRAGFARTSTDAGGWLPFDRYMEPRCTRPDSATTAAAPANSALRGDDGSDFVTAPELSPLFAATLRQRPTRRSAARQAARAT